MKTKHTVVYLAVYANPREMDRSNWPVFQDGDGKLPDIKKLQPNVFEGDRD